MALLLAGCGSDTPKSDPEAVAKVLTDAAHAVADSDGEKACGYLTPDAVRQAELQSGAGVLGSVDCPTLVKRATAFMAPLDRQKIKNLEPQNVQVNGTQASATLASTTANQPISVQLTLTKVGNDWKISGFGNAVGLPGA